MFRSVDLSLDDSIFAASPPVESFVLPNPAFSTSHDIISEELKRGIISMKAGATSSPPKSKKDSNPTNGNHVSSTVPQEYTNIIRAEECLHSLSASVVKISRSIGQLKSLTRSTKTPPVRISQLKTDVERDLHSTSVLLGVISRHLDLKSVPVLPRSETPSDEILIELETLRSELSEALAREHAVRYQNGVLQSRYSEAMEQMHGSVPNASDNSMRAIAPGRFEEVHKLIQDKSRLEVENRRLRIAKNAHGLEGYVEAEEKERDDSLILSPSAREGSQSSPTDEFGQSYAQSTPPQHHQGQGQQGLGHTMNGFRHISAFRPSPGSAHGTPLISPRVTEALNKTTDTEQLKQILKDALNDTYERSANATKEIEEYKQRVAELERTVHQAQTRATESALRCEELVQQLEEVDDRENQSFAELEAAQIAIDQLEQALVQKQRELEQAQSSIGKVQDDAFRELQAHNDELTDMISELRNELLLRVTTQAELETRVQQLTTDTEILRRDLASARKASASDHERLEKAMREQSRLITEAVEMRVSHHESVLREKDLAAQSLTKQLAACQAHVRTLQAELETQSSTHSDGARMATELGKALITIDDLRASLLKVTKERDELHVRHKSLQLRYSALVDEELASYSAQRMQTEQATAELQSHLRSFDRAGGAGGTP